MIRTWLEVFAWATFQLSVSKTTTISTVSLIYEALIGKIKKFVKEAVEQKAPKEIQEGESFFSLLSGLWRKASV